jgi:S1-C subfamily serine protease
MKSLLKSLFLLAVLTTAFCVPELKELYIREYVGSQVFKLTNIEMTGGGTGFVVKVPGGKTVLMTNSHVCEGIQKNSASSKIMATQGDKKFYLKVIKIYKKHDLCAIEAPKGYIGLSLGSEPTIGQLITIVGHPRLKPLTLSHGQIISEELVQIAVKQVSNPNECKDGTQVYYVPFYGILCVKTYPAIATNARAMPGNSGSPLVDSLGHVVAVLFCSDNEVFDGGAVPLRFLEAFLLDLSKLKL